MPDPYIVGESSPFLKRVLIPFWVIRIIIMVVLIAIYGLLIGAIAAIPERRLKGEYNLNVARNTVLAISAVVAVLIIICLILDIVSIVKRARRTLSPRFFLITNVLQTTLWLVYFILMAVGASSGVTIGIGVIIFLSFLGLLIYAAVVFHQFRTGKLGSGKYEPAYNPAAAGIAQQMPQPYAPTTAYGQTTTYGQTGYPVAAAEPSKPTYYTEVPMPQQQGYGQQTAAPQYGYEMQNRNPV